MKILIHWLVLALAVLAVPYVIDGIQVEGVLTAIIVAAILGFINTIIKPVIGILTLPINILTLGIFSLALNAVFFWFVAGFIDGFDVSGFTAAFWGALIVSAINWIGTEVIGE